jgi:hypothetical protein
MRIYAHAMHQDAVDRGWRRVAASQCPAGWHNVARAGEEVGGEVKPVRVEKLPNVLGKTLTAVVVTYAPGGKSAPISMPDAALPTCSRVRFAPRIPRPGRPGSIRPARASSSHPVVSISSAGMPAPRSRPACWQSLSPMMATDRKYSATRQCGSQGSEETIPA